MGSFEYRVMSTYMNTIVSSKCLGEDDVRRHLAEAMMDEGFPRWLALELAQKSKVSLVNKNKNGRKKDFIPNLSALFH